MEAGVAKAGVGEGGGLTRQRRRRSSSINSQIRRPVLVQVLIYVGAFLRREYFVTMTTRYVGGRWACCGACLTLVCNSQARMKWSHTHR